MLWFAKAFLVLALLAALFGYGGMGSYPGEGVKILFYIFLALALLSFLGDAYRRRSFRG